MSDDLLARALGDERVRLLGVADLQTALLEAEIALFAGTDQPIRAALPNAWYLHALAMSPATQDAAFEVRRGDAGRVAAHVFDLHLQQRAEEMSLPTRLRFIVAAQSGYHVGAIAPNAMAMAKVARIALADLGDGPGVMALLAAQFLFGQNLKALGDLLEGWRGELEAAVGSLWDGDDSPLDAIERTMAGIVVLRDYLLAGGADRIGSATAEFTAAIQNPFSRWDTDSRWVAALLMDFGSVLERTSIWNVVEPGSPVGRALTLGEPPIYTMWPPQAEFLSGTPSPFDQASRRMILSLPTSAGKTLVAQILTLNFLATQDQGACVIAPTHALCREIITALNSRLGMLATYASDGEAEGGTDPLSTSARVLVLTPERFGAILRSDGGALLERFGLFIIDEAHLLSEPQRGWYLEETLATLHHLTRDTAHQLVLVSAAMGHAAHTKQWLTLDQEPLARSTQWRGPRRLHALYGTVFGDDGWVVAPGVGNANDRRSRSLYGQVHLSGPGTTVLSAKFTEPAAPLVQRQRNDGSWTKDSSSPNEILRLRQLIDHLLSDESTKVLVVVAQRREVRELAEEIASHRAEMDASIGLAERLADRLPGHPLPNLVRHGVAYHHGLLPSDVQADIERAAATDAIRCVVSTTTLTEGVNLPFKAVIIGSTGWGSGENREVIIDTPRLLNAFGRAGRACRETEGWLFMAINESYAPGLFNQFEWDPSDLDLESALNRESAIIALAEFEALVAAGVDAVLTHSEPATRGFCSYVWFLAEILSDLGAGNDLPSIVAALQDTLAWQQLSTDAKEGWLRVAATSYSAYQATPEDRRHRWGRSGTSLPTNVILEGEVASIADVLAGISVPGDYSDWFRTILPHARVETLLGLAENPVGLRGFKPHRSAARTNLIEVDLGQLVLDWVAGVELDVIAGNHLNAINDDDYRADALSEFTAGALEHHLPWVTSTLVKWVNERLGVTAIPARLPAMLRYGVDSETALHLMSNGIRSRRLAHRVSDAVGEHSVAELRQMLRQQTLDQWRTDFSASPAELSDLLTFVRDPDQQPVADLLDGQTVAALAVQAEGAVHPDTGAEVILEEDVAGDEPRPISVVVDGQIVGTVSTEDHSHVRAMLRLGLPIQVVVGAVDASAIQLLVTTAAIGVP
jgi:hypothetical protein